MENNKNSGNLSSPVQQPEVTMDGGMRVHKKPVEASPKPFFITPATLQPLTPAEPTPEKVIPPAYPESPKRVFTVPPKGSLSGVPTPEQQSWGAIISIVIIVLMIVVGAFYAWGKRIAEEQALMAPSSNQQ